VVSFEASASLISPHAVRWSGGEWSKAREGPPSGRIKAAGLNSYVDPGQLNMRLFTDEENPTMG